MEFNLESLGVKIKFNELKLKINYVIGLKIFRDFILNIFI